MSSFEDQLTQLEDFSTSGTMTPQVVEMMMDNNFPIGSITAEQSTQVEAFRQSLHKKEICDAVFAEQLWEYPWFTENTALQAKLLKAVRCGLIPLITKRSWVFESALDKALQNHQADVDAMRAAIKDFFYLEERSWFNRNGVLQSKTAQVVVAGLGDRINVLAPDFDAHISQLLATV